MNNVRADYIPAQPATPEQVWRLMLDGNTRFLTGEPEHPHQDVERRNDLRTIQMPVAALFGCSDSRLAAEIIFDLGLGDLFVIRNAGQVIGDSVIGSLEYATEIVGVPLIVVLGHDACGAVSAAITAQHPGAPRLPPHIEHLIEPILPAVRRVTESLDPARPGELPSPVDVGREHLRDTAAELLNRSPLILKRVGDGKLGIVTANYQLHDGRVTADTILGFELRSGPAAAPAER